MIINPQMKWGLNFVLPLPATTIPTPVQKVNDPQWIAGRGQVEYTVAAMDREKHCANVAADVISVEAGTPVESAVMRFCGRPGGFALERSGPDGRTGRFTILGCDPIETVCVGAAESADPLAAWGERMEAMPVCAPLPDPAVPFAGGWVGYVAYEAGLGASTNLGEPKPGRLLPDLRFCLYDTVAVYEHGRQRWYAAGIDWAGLGPPDRPPLGDRLSRVRDSIVGCPDPGPGDGRATICEAPVPNMPRSAYLDKVRRIREYIGAGDVYQVNLTQRFSARTDAAPLEVYRRLCRANPAPFAAYLAWDDRAVLSSSPELFLDVRGPRVVTRPIKGTRPRIGDPVVDAIRQEELLRSEKDRAELNMIIDLLRNDLGRVCRFGSVRVTSAGEAETHPTVFHRVATVVGELAEGRARADLLRATFPGGSITGAPKVRAMQIIDELEPTPRDVYCGSIGYVGLDGSMLLNIAIRTMVMRGSWVHLYAGGGIVADSDPEDEYEESLAKAAGMMRALGHEVFGRARAWQ